jgi:hypothetical protein
MSCRPNRRWILSTWGSGPPLLAIPCVAASRTGVPGATAREFTVGGSTSAEVRGRRGQGSSLPGAVAVLTANDLAAAPPRPEPAPRLAPRSAIGEFGSLTSATAVAGAASAIGELGSLTSTGGRCCRRGDRRYRRARGDRRRRFALGVALDPTRCSRNVGRTTRARRLRAGCRRVTSTRSGAWCSTHEVPHRRRLRELDDPAELLARRGLQEAAIESRDK